MRTIIKKYHIMVGQFLRMISVMKKKKVSGYTDIVIKNSAYKLITTFAAKFGGLIFTVILAHLLAKDLFGLYNLTLSILLLFIGFTDLGISTALINFVSFSLAKKNSAKAKAYMIYLSKLKIFLIFGVSIVLLIFAKFFINNYYEQPLFLGLVAGILYVISIGIMGFVEQLFQADNNFKGLLWREIIFQIIRIALVPLIIILFIKSSSNEIGLFWIIFALSLTTFVTLAYLCWRAKKEISFFNAKSEKLNKAEKSKLLKYIAPLAVLAIFGIGFGYIEMIILGGLVFAEFIGDYSAALNLVGTIVAMTSFAVVLFPIFSRLEGRRLNNALKKSVKFTLLASISLMIITFIAAPLLINIIFGKEYANAILLLRTFSLVLIILPVITIYEDFLISQAKTKVVTMLIIFFTILNIGMIYGFSSYLLAYGQLAAVLGAIIATTINKYLYLFALIYAKKHITFKR